MKKSHRAGIQAIAVLILLVGGIFLFRHLASQRPDIAREDPLPPAPMVRVETVAVGDHPIKITGEGTVSPVREIRLVPEVSGKVIWLAESLKDGGSFEKGEVMLKIDPRDYEVAVAQARARLADARALLQRAREESEAATDEWREHFSPGPDQAPPPLVARIPQLEAAQAQMDALAADLERAKLNLERSQIKAPFAGQVTDKAVDIGQFVTPGQVLAGFFDTSAVEIAVPLEDHELAWFSVPGFTQEGGQGSLALVRATVAGQDREWLGFVSHAQARMDTRSRMVRVVVRVENPYAQKPPAAVGLFANVEITGRTLEGVAFLPRAALRQGTMVWKVDSENRLRFAPVTVARVSDEGVIVTDGLSQGDRVVVSLLHGVSDGMLVRVANSNSVEAPAVGGQAGTTQE
ncbi:MAG: efflux RND transporter periplasmic adaptor subunit [Desulfatibacillaceae bacterium]|nr:efflux RND transporter periplasmic adaptor subunit [Desulfatibacillaceae bacterium]